MSDEVVVMDAPAVDVAAAVEAPVETPVTEVQDTPEVNSKTQPETVEAVKTETSKIDGEEGKAETKADQTADVAMPKQVSDMLKQLTDANPESKQVKSVVKEIRDAYFKSQVYAQAFPSAADARQASAFIKELGGVQQLQEYIQSVQESDNLLAAGDPQLVQNIVDDLKSNDSIAALDKLTPAFMDKWAKESPRAYSAYFQKTIATQLKNSGLHETLEKVWKTELTPTARREVKNIASWLESLSKNASSFETETKQQAELQTKASQKEIGELNVKAAEAAEASSNKILGAELGKLRATVPSLKALSKEQLQPLAVEIKKSLHAALRSANSDYQTKMDKLYANGKGLKSNFDKILKQHSDTVESIKAKVVRDSIRKVYPQINLDSKPAPAAPKINPSSVSRASVAEPRSDFKLPTPVQVAERPKNLVRELDADSMLQIAGKGWVNDPSDKSKVILVQWRR